MKNTDLIKLENILTYIGEFDKVHPLTEDVYTSKEVSKIFSCTMAQIRGYLNNYKKYFEGYVEVTGTPGKQITKITKEGVFLLAILLDGKSKLAKQVSDKVRDLIANPKIEKVYKPVQEEMNFEEPKFKEESPVTLRQVIKDGNSTEENEIDLPEEKLDEIFNKVIEEERSMLKELVSKLNDLINKSKEESEKSDIDKIDHDLLNADHILQTHNIMYKNYMEKCKILGFNDLESAILIQESFNKDRDTDKEILDALYRKAQQESLRKRGVLKESIELLASEKFEGNIPDTYHYLSNELRFYLGINMMKIREKHKEMNINPTSYLDFIISENGYDYAMDIISTLLSE